MSGAARYASAKSSYCAMGHLSRGPCLGENCCEVINCGRSNCKYVPCPFAECTKGERAARALSKSAPARIRIGIGRLRKRAPGKRQRGNEPQSGLKKGVVQAPHVEEFSIPLSILRFSLSHFHRCNSASFTTRATSSSLASLPCFTHSGSGQPTLPTSPSSMHSFQKSSRQDRQKI